MHNEEGLTEEQKKQLIELNKIALDLFPIILFGMAAVAFFKKADDIIARLEAMEKKG